MIPRMLAAVLSEVAGQYPVALVTGPRQSGKTTLCRAVFPAMPYVSLEPLDVRSFARADPRGFLAQYPHGAILDEVQHAPDLFSYLQVEVDENPEHGRFILTGSEHFGLSQGVSQSLAGRIGVLTLLPPSLDELRGFPDAPHDLWSMLWSGAYPRIYDQHIEPGRWWPDYFATYIQRDVRQLLNVGDLEAFSTFVGLCAGRTAQEINLSSLGADAGVSHNTARSWLSILEASYICFRLPAWRQNATKRLIKAPKLHFFDSGLVCYLLGIGDPATLTRHPLRGAVFESWVASEIYKARIHRGLSPRMAHYRDARGLEVDLVVEARSGPILVETKSGATVASDFFKPLEKLAEMARVPIPAGQVALRLIYGGTGGQKRSGVTVIPWSDVPNHAWD